MSSIRLHREHGVNPTIAVCVWCGKDKNEIALLGARYPGKAPRHMVLDKQPCETCQASMKLGITFAESIDQKLTGFNGKWCVLKEEAVERLLSDNPDLLAHVLEKRRAFVEVGLLKMIGVPEENTPDAT